MRMEFLSGMSLVFLLCSQPTGTTATTVFPQATDDVLVNPHMGWVMAERLRTNEVVMGTESPVDGDWEKVRTIMLRSGWALLNPAENVYDWDLFDEAFAYWDGQGKDISFRIVTDGNIMGAYRGGCPQWVYDKGVAYTEIERNGIMTRLADLNDSAYQTELVKFQQAFVSHLQASNWLDKVVQIDLRAYGEWGEWHSGFDFTNMTERVNGLKDSIDNTVNPFLNAGWDGVFYVSDSYEWRNEMTLPLSINLSSPPSYADFIQNSAFDYAFENPFVAVRRDGFGEHIKSDYDSRHMLEEWRSHRKPLHAEIGKKFSVYNDGDIYGMDPQAALDQMVTYHCNFIDGWVLLKDSDFYDTCQGWVSSALEEMGYRLAPVVVKYPSIITQGSRWYVLHTWQNVANGRLYIPYNVKFYLMNGSTVVHSFHDWDAELTTCLLGDNPEIYSYFPCPTEDKLPNGTYDLRIAIVDETGTAHVQMPLPDGDLLNRYKIGTITVDSSASAPAMPSVQGFESGTVAGTGYDLGPYSTISTNSINANYSMVADVPESIKWQHTLLYTNSLEAGATYKVSFRYCLLDEQGGTFYLPGLIQFLARSSTGGIDADRGVTRWLDEPGLTPAVRTVYLTLGNYSDYYLEWDLRWGGKIALDNIRIEKMTSPEAFYSQDFESGQFSSECWSFSSSGISTNDAIEGTYSVSGSVAYDPATLSPHWTPLLGCQPGFETNSTYTLSFSYVQWEAADWGGYNYVTLKTPTGGGAEEVRLLKWIDLAGDETRKTVTFTTGIRTDYRLIWGLRNGGSVGIDDITIIKNN